METTELVACDIFRKIRLAGLVLAALGHYHPSRIESNSTRFGSFSGTHERILLGQGVLDDATARLARGAIGFSNSLRRGPSCGIPIEGRSLVDMCLIQPIVFHEMIIVDFEHGFLELIKAGISRVLESVFFILLIN